MIYLLDTNILVYLTKNQPPAIAQRTDVLPEEAQLCMSFITSAELLKGAERSTRKPVVLRGWKRWRGRWRCCIRAARPSASTMSSSSRAEGRRTPIGAHNLWIACHALAESATLVTHNTREFQRVEGLKLEAWVATG